MLDLLSIYSIFDPFLVEDDAPPPPPDPEPEPEPTPDPIDGITFTTLGHTLVLPEGQLIIYPYNFIPPMAFGQTNYSLMVSDRFNYSATCLFRYTMALTYEQRLQLQTYFDYWQTNRFDIQIIDQFWIGYLTHHNQDLLKRQFKNEDSEIMLQFEAMRIK
jgi:hypothetical protein